MKAIYASKLYRASKRKDHIKAALVNSNNVALVQQLADNLDEEYQRPELLISEEEQEEKEQAQQGQGQPSSSGSSEGGHGGGGGMSIPSSLSSGIDPEEFDPEEDLVDFPEGEDGEVSEGDNDSEPEFEPNNNPSEEDIAEATEIRANEETCCLSIDDLSSLKNNINLIGDIAGVTRIASKEDEIWIYYNDDTNPNNIMTDVIEYVAKLYPCLEFNRLARSDNAIVFEMVKSTPSEVAEKEDK